MAQKTIRPGMKLKNPLRGGSKKAASGLADYLLGGKFLKKKTSGPKRVKARGK